MSNLRFSKSWSFQVKPKTHSKEAKLNSSNSYANSISLKSRTNITTQKSPPFLFSNDKECETSAWSNLSLLWVPPYWTKFKLITQQETYINQKNLEVHKSILSNCSCLSISNTKRKNHKRWQLTNYNIQTLSLLFLLQYEVNPSVMNCEKWSLSRSLANRK